MDYIIKRLYKIIHSYENLQKKIKINKVKLDPNVINTQINNIISSPFFSKKYITPLKTVANDLNLYEITLSDSRVIQINIYTTLSVVVIKKLLNYICFIIFLNQHYWKKEVSSNLNITIVPLDISKFLPYKYEIIDIEHINSASSTIYYNNPGAGNIYIWRKDELSKVLVHELLHSFNYDQNLLNITNTGIFKNIDSLNLNETFTELSAVLICIGITSFQKSKNLEQFKTIFIKKLKDENKLSQNNVKKLMKYNNLDSVSDFTSFKYKQNASIFSYIILKAAIIFYLLNKNKILFLKEFPKPFDNSLELYVSELEKIYKSKAWNTYVEYLPNPRKSTKLFFTSIKT